MPLVCAAGRVGAFVLILAGLAVLAGLWCLLAPPRAMLFGSRWQLRDGDSAEPSQAWIAYTRGSGVVLLIAAVILTIWFFVAQGQSQTKASLKEAWDIGVYGSVSELRIEVDPVVEQVSDVEATLAAYDDVEQGLRVWKTAIVGTDPVGDLGTELDDGELVLAVRAGSCRPGPVLVHETDSTVTVSVTGKGNKFSSGVVIPCGGSGISLLKKPSAEQLLIVRVPLAEPLGERELVLPDPPDRDQQILPSPNFTR